jgi:hypothetical protein
MDIKEFEDLINKTISSVVVSIIDKNKILNISAKSRAGAEISDFLETQFVILANSNRHLLNAEQSPKGATKNPWDAKVHFKYENHLEEIWIDFKAIKIDQLGSNPDIGTPTKIVNFIQNGGFYLLYIYVFYRETDNGLEFCKVNDSFVKSYFLKDVHCSVRRNPKNQLQVCISTEPEYRTREEFIDLLFSKLKESYYRQIKIGEKELLTLEEKQAKIKEFNRQQETLLLNLRKS